MNGWTMRHMQPRDVARVLELAAEQNRRDGTSYPVPLLFGPVGQLAENTPLALVTEYEGEVRQADVFVRSVEMMCFGTDPRATAFSRHEMPRAAYLLGLRGYEGVHCFVPKGRVSNVARPLERAGYERCDEQLAHFYRNLE